MTGAGVAVLLHGWGGSFQTTFVERGWPTALTALNLRPVGIDLPGHAMANASTVAQTYCDLASDVEAMLPPGELIIIGYSLGAKIALELASREPLRYRCLVLAGIGDNVFQAERVGPALLEALQNGICADTPKAIADLVQYASRSDSNSRALMAVLDRPPNPIATSSKLERILCPILVANGDMDRVALPNGLLLKSLSQALDVKIAGNDHISILDDRLFLQHACEFIKSHNFTPPNLPC